MLKKACTSKFMIEKLRPYFLALILDGLLVFIKYHTFFNSLLNLKILSIIISKSMY